MSLILGIDTGGTYTDGVIIDAESGGVLYTAKALTTKKDLWEGIAMCIESLGFKKFEDIVLVCLSTTLATNAIVEGRGGTAGVIMLGSLPKGDLPTKNAILINGKLDIKGREQENLVDSEIEGAIEQMMGKVDAIAISGYASVRNPVHERKVKSKIREKTGIPVVCAHELTSNLGYYERTVTAILNAKLIPIIEDLISAVKKVLLEKGIDAPIMMVKGDGSLMHESFAEEKPVETILSGPAASIIGGKYLSKRDDGLIFDMGGTTSDIANINEGVVKIKKEGAIVGGWRTCVQAAEICTYGLGGDSHIYLDGFANIRIGPKKVTPLCVAGSRYPWLKEELVKYKRKPGYELCSENECDCFEIQRIRPRHSYDEMECQILDELINGAHSLFYLSEKLGKDPEAMKLTKLVDDGSLGRISITPTDLLHVEGTYVKWDKETAEEGIKILSGCMGISEEKFIEVAKQTINYRIAQILLESTAEFERGSFNILRDEGAKYVFQSLTCSEQERLITLKIKINKPIIGIGAPSEVWLNKINDLLEVEIVIPEHAEVANAVGAAVGQVMQSVEAIIRLDPVTKKYVVFGCGERMGFDDLDEAKGFALKSSIEKTSNLVKTAGSSNYKIVDSVKDIFTENYTAETRKYVETKIKIVGIGKPDWK